MDESALALAEQNHRRMVAEARARWPEEETPDAVTHTGSIDLAAGSFVYMALDADGEVLYVGLTGSVPIRLTAHSRRAKWWPLVRTVRWEAYPTRQAAAIREARLIRTLEPPHNRVHSWPVVR